MAKLRMFHVVVLVMLAAVIVVSSGASPSQAPARATTPDEQRKVARSRILERWTGDLEGMIARRRIRIATAYNRTLYFIDKGVQRGAAYESFKLFESELNKKLNPRNLRLNVVFIPVPHDELLSSVVEGRADMAAAALTVTPEREKLVDFTPATRTNVNEIVVTGPGAPTIASADDLAGQDVFVRKSSSYYDSLIALNRQLKAKGKKDIVIKLAPETLDTEDIIEMVNAGLVKITVADNYLAEFWKPLLPAIVLHEDIQLRSGGHLAVAVRKNSPQLVAEATAWIKEYGPRTAFGNVMTQRYLKSTKFAKSATSQAALQRFHQTIELFRKYGQQYRLDYLLLAAQAFQESGLDHSVRSPVGAVGVMQILPATGKEMNVGDIMQVENNIHAGVKYIRLLIDRYYATTPMDPFNRAVFAFAAYNAGAGQIRQLRLEAEKRGLNPNVWFNNVEQIASERIGREPVTYVSNIYKYYLAYQLVLEEIEARRKVRH